jgi:hypothetical protein
MNDLAADRALDTEMLVNGFEKSEIASNGQNRVFFSNPSPLKYKMIIDGEEIECEAPKSIVIETSPSRDHYNIYTFSPTLMLDRKPISQDLRPSTMRFDLHEFVDWLPNLNTLFIIEAIRRGYGVEFDSRPNRESETSGEYFSSNTSNGGFA